MAWALMLTGCVGQQATVDAGAAQRLAKMTYPSRMTLGDDLDIVVTRDDHDVTLTNRTATAYRDAHVWLNQQYVGVIAVVPIGRAVRVSLQDFVNRHRERFPTGTLLRPESARDLLLAELIQPADQTGDGPRRHRLLVRQP